MKIEPVWWMCAVVAWLRYTLRLLPRGNWGWEWYAVQHYYRFDPDAAWVKENKYFFTTVDDFWDFLREFHPELFE